MEERELEKLKRREQLISKIIELFPDPGWPRDKPAYDERTDGIDQRYIIEHFHGRRWRDVSPEELAWAVTDAWAFSTEGIAYFMPAFLIQLLKERVGSYILMADIEGARDRFWNEDQRKLIDKVFAECGLI